MDNTNIYQYGGFKSKADRLKLKEKLTKEEANPEKLDKKATKENAE